jgi:hypothetical protein
MTLQLGNERQMRSRASGWWFIVDLRSQFKNPQGPNFESELAGLALGLTLLLL